MLRTLSLLIILILVINSISPLIVSGTNPGSRDLVLEASPHIWYRMAESMIILLYNSSLGLFRETWGTSEGRCWYWNTEQGEAAQITVFADRRDIISSMLESYRRHLAFESDGFVYMFSRYTPCKTIRTLSLDPSNFSIGNLIVNIGGDLAGGRDDPIYSRVIAVGLDTYKDLSNSFERVIAWPSQWYVINLRSHEVWYRAPNETSDYKGIWDTSSGSLGTGQIVDYGITYNTTYMDAYRVMSDGRLTYEQHFVLEPGKPYIKALLVAENTGNMTLSDVRVSLAFDNLDWWLYQLFYAPGIGFINASTSGQIINNGSEKEYHLAYSWTNQWQKIIDSQGNSWWPTIIYSNKPIGMNRALLVLVDGEYDVHLWGYGNRQSPENSSNTSTRGDWYYRWLKYEITIGELEPGESRAVELRIIPFASYPPGLEHLILEMARRMDSLEGRDWSYAVNTGTGAFKGLAMSVTMLNNLGPEDYEFVEEILYTVSTVFDNWNWRAATRILSNLALAFLYLYDNTGNETYLETAEKIAIHILGLQVRNISDPRNGGFLDAPYPYGKATYLDVNAEAANTLLELYKRTGNTTYKEAVDYWLDHWWHKDNNAKWYYYHYRSIEDSPGPGWYKRYLDKEEPYALGYLLQALSNEYWDDERLLVSANRIWTLLDDNYWEKTRDDANETNVETQSSTTAGLRAYLYSMTKRIGIGIEYVRGGTIKNITYHEHSRQHSSNITWIQATITITTRKQENTPVAIALYIPKGEIISIQTNNTLNNTINLTELQTTNTAIYYWDYKTKILYIKLTTVNTIILTYKYPTTTITSQQSTNQTTQSYTSTEKQNGSEQTRPKTWKNKLIYATIILLLIIYAIILFNKNTTR